MDDNQSISRVEVSDCSELIEINHQDTPKTTIIHTKIKNIQIPNLIVSDSASSSCGSSAKHLDAPTFVRDDRIKSSSVHDLRQHSVNYNLLSVECVGVSFLSFLNSLVTKSGNK